MVKNTSFFKGDEKLKLQRMLQKRQEDILQGKADGISKIMEKLKRRHGQ
jgi:hypothetical protein